MRRKSCRPSARLLRESSSSPFWGIHDEGMCNIQPPVARTAQLLREMKMDRPAGKNTLEELYGEGYFSRVCGRSLIVFALVAMMLAGRGGLPALIGFSYGAAVSLGSLKLVELMVRWFLRPDLPWDRARISLLMVLKLPLLSVIIAAA